MLTLLTTDIIMYRIMSMNTPTIPQIPDITSVTDLRYKARTIINRVHEHGKTILVTRDSDPMAVLLPVHLYNAIREYIEDTRDLAEMKKVLTKDEPSTDFLEFEKTQRKRRHLPKYVPRTATK